MTIPIMPAGSSADVTLTALFASMPLIMPMFLFILYIIILAGGYFLQEKRTGMADFKTWTAIAGFVISILAIVMYLVPGLINNATLIAALGVGIGGVAYFLIAD